MHYAVIDSCPCPKPLLPILKKLKAETGCTYNSIYRGDDVLGLLHKNGKKSQRELYDGFVRGLPGYLPANPPTQGTHILLGDGTVGDVGEKLHFWQCGIDLNDDEVDEVIAAARKHGWVLYRPYPGTSESHHVNFAKKPSRWRAFFRNVFGPKKRKRRPEKKPAKGRIDHPRVLSEHGAKFIAEFEGFSSEPYNDPAGHATIGYGHLIHLGPVTNADRANWHNLDETHGLVLLRKDAEQFERAVRDLVDVPLNQNQFDALVSFAYNLGAGALAESTLLKKLNHGNYRAVPRQMKRWDKADGVALAGLTRRRAAEGHLFSKPTTTRKGNR